jgi:hypothetical protein
VFAGQQPGQNSEVFAASQEDCWMAVSRAVLALNFGMETQDPARGFLQASQHFKRYRGTTTVTLRVNLEPEGDQTRVYASADERTEKVFTRSHTRFFLWVIPLPGGGGAEAARVKTGEWTVRDRKFYRSFFQAVEQELNGLAAEPAAPMPGSGAAPGAV